MKLLLSVPFVARCIIAICLIQSSDAISIDLSDKIPVLSEIEEARSLQYQCECIESAFVEQGRFARPHRQ